MTSSHTLLLLRHAEAESLRPGHPDHARRLTQRGREQARAVGDAIRSCDVVVEHVLCSTATRARETLSELALPATATVELLDALFTAGSDSILKLIRSLPAEVGTALVVGHAPGIPGTLYELASPESADPAVWSRVAHRFPAATLARLRLRQPWTNLAAGSLTAVYWCCPPGRRLRRGNKPGHDLVTRRARVDRDATLRLLDCFGRRIRPAKSRSGRPGRVAGWRSRQSGRHEPVGGRQV